MMPGIIISFVVSEQMLLIGRTAPWESELACPVKPLEDPPHRFCVQIRAADRPRSSWSNLLPF